MRIYFTARLSLFSLLVCWLTRKPYSHVAIGMPDGYVYEATWTGVHRIRLVDFFKKQQIKAVFPLDRHPLEHLLRAKELLGRAYDVPAILWFLVVLLLARINIKVPRLTINPRWLICSEYVWYVVTGEYKTVTPDDVYEKISNPPQP